MKKAFLFLFFITIISCSEKKQYYYISISEEIDINDKISIKEKEIIKEYSNDSLASLHSYLGFCQSQKIDNDFLKNKTKLYSKTIDFKLLNDRKQPIDIDKYLHKKTKDSISNVIFSRESYFSKSNEEVEFKNESSYNEKVCSISENFIKKDLYNPKTADFSIFDCKVEVNGSNYTILRKVSAQNSFGVEKEFIYKLVLEYLGGNEYDESSWKLKLIRSEEYR